MKPALVFVANRVVLVPLAFIMSNTYLKSTNCSSGGSAQAISQFIADLQKISTAITGSR